MFNYQKILKSISELYQGILADKLVGIYVHGSIAFGCFNLEVSDIDFLVVVRKEPKQEEKENLIKTLLDLSDAAPAKGFEMSVVMLNACRDFTYPTPFVLHYSNAHFERCRENLREYCQTMKGLDKDLAAHFMVIRSVGIVLYGETVDHVFGDVRREYYLDSIKQDVIDADTKLHVNHSYYVLNQCRALAYITENRILSKEQGGLWALDKLPHHFTKLLHTALAAYRLNKDPEWDLVLLGEFYNYMKQRIFTKV